MLIAVIAIVEVIVGVYGHLKGQDVHIVDFLSPLVLVLTMVRVIQSIM